MPLTLKEAYNGVDYNIRLNRKFSINDKVKIGPRYVSCNEYHIDEITGAIGTIIKIPLLHPGDYTIRLDNLISGYNEIQVYPSRIILI